VLQWLEHDPRPANLSIVWLPMLSTDDATAASSSASQFQDSRVTQFWDPARLAGVTWATEFQVDLVPALLAVVPEDHHLRLYVEQWIADPANHPAWDIAYFYPAGVKWLERVPAPESWTKQVGFWGLEEPPDSSAAENLTTGTFWTDRSLREPIDSDWTTEFALGMARVLPAAGK
jgi:hypothetical protein